MKTAFRTVTIALVGASTPGLAQEHATILQEIASLRQEVRALRTTIERQRRPALAVSNARLEYSGGSSKAAADVAARDACRQLGYEMGSAQNFVPRQSGNRPFLTAYVCSDRPGS